MKKIFLLFFPLVLSLAMILPGATAVMADSEKEVKPQPVGRASLMIRAPSMAEVGQPVTITVFGRYNHQPIAGAEVYALKTDKMAVTADKKNYTTTAADYIALLDEEVTFLGETNAEGSINHKFVNGGRYLLVAFKAGYIPGFSRITITLSPTKGLRIKAPGSAEAGKPVTMTVVERSSHEPVAKAAVYATKIGVIGLPKPAVASVFRNIIGVAKPTTGTAPSTDVRITKVEPAKVEAVKVADEAQNAEEFKKNGIFIGYTNDKGEVVFSFNETGHFALAAFKEDYAPGFARIHITPTDQKALGIKTPDKAEIGKPVTMTVFERNTYQPVAKAGVYALRLGDIFTAVPAEKPTTMINTPEPTTVAPEVAVTAETVKEKGIFLGYTDDKGQVVHSFDKTGRYVLAAVKENYQPGFARISIVLAEQKAIGIKVPEKAEVGKPVTIVTYDRNTFGPVPKAAVYALRIGEIDTPVPLEPILKSEAAYFAEAEKYAADVKAKGIFLGYTNENAHLVYSFNKTGHYLLVAIKDGYAPDFARIQIKPRIIVPQKPEVVPPPTPLPTT